MASLVLATGCARVADAPSGGPTAQSSPESASGHAACTSPSEDLNFRNQWVGASFEGLRLTTVIRYCADTTPDLPTRVNYVSYLYGTCEPGPDSGCAVPLEVQSWHPKERYEELYEMAPTEHRIEKQDTSVGGVRAAWFEGGHRLEIFHGDVTVAIFGEGRDQIERVATALVDGPSRLTELEEHGLVFDEKCVDDRHYCEAEPREGNMTPSQ
jgi:hypothetical protein